MFGWDGYHLQSPGALAAALQRDDGKEGGVLLFVAAKDKVKVERQAKEKGFEIAPWDKCTPQQVLPNETKNQVAGRGLGSQAN